MQVRIVATVRIDRSIGESSSSCNDHFATVKRLHYLAQIDTGGGKEPTASEMFMPESRLKRPEGSIEIALLEVD